jgi:hypothetical protein
VQHCLRSQHIFLPLAVLKHTFNMVDDLRIHPARHRKRPNESLLFVGIRITYWSSSHDSRRPSQ